MRAAEAGFVEAILELAEARDPSTLRFLVPAAERGDSECMRQLALEYERGGLLPRSPRLAFEWMHRAATADDGFAVFSLGWYYANGFGCVRDDEAALELYADAAARGFVEAAFNAALILWERGTHEDGIRAVSYFEQAALHHHVKAARFLEGDEVALF